MTSILAITFLLGFGAGEEYLSPLVTAIDPQGKRIYVAGHTARKIVVLDRTRLEMILEIDLPGKPTGMALSEDGSRLYTTVDGRVLILDAEHGKTLDSIASGYGACSPVPGPSNGNLHVCNRYDNTVSVLDIPKRELTATIPVVREPVAAALTPDGKLLFVANHLPAGAADRDFIGAVVSVIEFPEGKVSSIQLPNGSTGLRGICVSPDGRYVYTTHILARYQLPTTQLDRGWINTNALSIIDVKKRALLNTVLLDDVNLGAANPWDVKCTDSHIVVSHAGTHELSVIDQPALLARLSALDEAKAADVPNDLAFLVDVRRRIRLKGRGPRGLSLEGNTAYTAEYFSDSIGVVKRDEDVHAVRSVPLGPGRAFTRERRGEMLFNDGTICFQQWQSCASCHPDGRTDGLNWDLLNDGFGNPKNTKSLLLSHETPPAMAMGVRDSAEAAVRAGLRYILFCTRPEEDAEAIDAYLEKMAPEPSPCLVEGKMSDGAMRGRSVFEKAGCLACHPGPLYSDLNAYDLKSLRGSHNVGKLDTPTLIEVWRTAPYLHDGRAETLKSMLTRHNKGNLHGQTGNLSEKELADLIEFVLSL
jgi:YVTN family beta-propeller protein